MLVGSNKRGNVEWRRRPQRQRPRVSIGSCVMWTWPSDAPSVTACYIIHALVPLPGKYCKLKTLALLRSWLNKPEDKTNSSINNSPKVNDANLRQKVNLRINNKSSLSLFWWSRVADFPSLSHTLGRNSLVGMCKKIIYSAKYTAASANLHTLFKNINMTTQEQWICSTYT